MPRFASTQREVAQDSSLLRILRDEISHEEEEYEPSRGLAMGPPQPFKLEDKPGKLEVTLRRSFGQEDIKLTAMFQPGMGVEGEEFEEDEELPEQNVVHLTVAITKGPEAPTLEFGCVVQKNDFQIGHVHFVEEKGAKDPNFDGPDFSQLDEQLQRQFKKYLDARGVNEELANYLLDLLEDKEQREYQRWLHNVEAFIRK
jgi:complement component 1 Q subcomponent-binding protein